MNSDTQNLTSNELIILEKLYHFSKLYFDIIEASHLFKKTNIPKNEWLSVINSLNSKGLLKDCEINNDFILISLSESGLNICNEKFAKR